MSRADEAPEHEANQMGPSPVQAPSSFTVAGDTRRPVLYQADGTPLTRRPIGFRS